MTERELLTAGLRELGVAECPSAADNLLRYSEILREKNKVKIGRASCRERVSSPV